MTEQNPYLYALTADPNKPLREAKETLTKSLGEIVRLRAECERLTVERDEARMRLAEAKTRMVRLLSQLQELEAREQ